MKPDQIYADPSALARLYFHQEGTREMTAWRAKFSGPLAVTHHGRIEIINAICRGAFLGHLNKISLSESLADLSQDFADGHLVQADILWRAALSRAADLSVRYTPEFGVRALDVLHVACAIEMKLHHFLSFDRRQQQLAAAVGLRLVSV